MPRIGPPRDPVTIHLDGEPIVAARGEPAVAALVAASRVALARSPKFHRPRGPACLRAACDGCLARVGGVPNVMTCRIPAVEGLRIETQNVVGSRDTDLLRVADWFFAEGMNHHELFAGVPVVERLMRSTARRVAGLGRLPEMGGDPRATITAAARATAPRAVMRRAVDVLVVGSGPSGMAVAVELASRGRQVEVADDDLAWGGSARILPAGTAQPWSPLIGAFAAALASGQVTVRLRTTVAGIYGDDVLVASEDSAGPPAAPAGLAGVEVLNARTLVLAPGAHDGVVAFEGNDVPGVMSARAGCRLLALGVIPGSKIVVAGLEGGGPFGAAYVHARPEAAWVAGAPVRVRGSGRVKGVTVAAKELPCDTLLVDAPRAPAYELCAQAGAELRRDDRGYAVVPGPGGRLRDGIFAAGEVAGTVLHPEAMREHARALADAL